MPLLWLSLAFILGILSADWSGWAAEAAWLGIGAAALLLWQILRRVLPGWAMWLSRTDPGLKLAPLFLLVAFVAGGLRYAAAHRPPEVGDLAFYNGQGHRVLRGWVADFPDQRDQITLLRVAVEEILPQEKDEVVRVRGLALVMLAPGGSYAYGQRVELVGSPVDPPEAGDFSYRNYLARKGIYTYLAYPVVQVTDGQSGNWLTTQVYRLRAAGLDVIMRLFPAPESQLLAGILLGADAGMPDALSAAFQATGMAHIIAISGFNMAVLSGLFLGLFSKVLTRWWAAGAAVLSLAGYSLLVGGGPSVLRAAIMCALAIIAVQIGRSAGAFNALMLSAGVMCLFDPNLLWDVSFQLTFAATAGLMLYAGPLQGWFAGLAVKRLPEWLAERLVGPVSEYVLCTLAAQLTTLPLIVWHFGRLSLSSLIANPLVLPPQAALMVLGGLAVAFGLVWEPFGQLFALLAWPLAAYTNRLVEWLAQIPAGQIALGPDGAVWVAVLCAMVMAMALLRERLRQTWGLVRPGLVLLVVAGLTLVTWRTVLSAPDGRLHLTVLDLQGGPAVLLRSPQGAVMLIGGADNASELESALGRRLAPVGSRLDGLVLAWPHGMDGLAGTLEVYPADQVFRCVDISGGRLADLFMAGNVPVEAFNPRRGLQVGDQLRLEAAVLSEDGCALRVRLGRLDLLLPGDLTPEQLPAETYATNSIVVGTGELGTWQQAGLRVLTPPPGGWLEVQTDGMKMWVESGR